MTEGLTIRGLVAGYAGSTVLYELDLDVPVGQVLVVLGRNGVGKTTLVNTVMGLVRRTAGTIRFGDVELGTRSDLIARTGVALVPQGRRVFAPLTVEEHLKLAERLGARRRRRSAAYHPINHWTPPAVLQLLPRLGERLHHRGNELSGGEQQMLAIARALLNNPQLLLLDEPSDGLAPTLVEQISEVITTLSQQGITILLVEQNLRLAFAVADQVAVMQKGRVVLNTTLEDFRSDQQRAHNLLGVT